MMCLQVRESEDEDWQFFYSGIDGFTFVPGYTYELIVNVTEIENPPADGSSLQYTLVQVVSRSPAYTGEPLPLVGTEWLLRAFGEEQMVRYDETTTPVTILFNQDGSVSGNAGCNNFTGGFTDDGATITVGPLATTMMMCPEEAMAVETAFLDGIQGTHAYTINGDMLEIVYAAGVLTFEAQETMVEAAPEAPASGEASALDGTSWALTSLDGSMGIDFDPVATPVTLVFEEGRVAGVAGCNNFNGGYSVDGMTLSLSPLASTMMMCPDDAMAVEQAYLGALQSGDMLFEIDGDTLLLTTSVGLLTFEAQETPAAAAPEAPAGGEASPLEGTTWALTSLDGSMGIDFDAIATPVTLVFEDGNAAGVSGCNNYAGGYTVDGMTLTFGMLISTMMMCEDDAMAVEQAYLAALQSGPVLFEIDGDMLLLTTSVGVLTFVDAAGTVQASSQEAPAAGAPAAEGDSLPLVGTTWTLVAMDESMGVAFDPAVVTVDATFEADGSVYGTAGCNRFTGSYSSDDGSITFGPVALTRMMCPAPMMDVERAVTAAVQGGVQYSISGNTLTMTTATGVLTFEG
jgi:heat shock protein HslJ